MADARIALVTTVAAALMVLAMPALAHSGGGGGGNGGASSGGGGGNSGGANGSAAGNTSNGAVRGNSPSCAPGYVLKDGGCLHVSRGVLPDDQLYAQGRALALAGYYTHALPILEAVARLDSMVYTMRGYAMRKLGHVDEGMALYARALAIDPRNVNTHEYMGEAYVIAGRVSDARAELTTVESICGGTACEQYTDLAKAIATGKPE